MDNVEKLLESIELSNDGYSYFRSMQENELAFVRSALGSGDVSFWEIANEKIKGYLERLAKKTKFEYIVILLFVGSKKVAITNLQVLESVLENLDELNNEDLSQAGFGYLTVSRAGFYESGYHTEFTISHLKLFSEMIEDGLYNYDSTDLETLQKVAEYYVLVLYRTFIATGVAGLSHRLTDEQLGYGEDFIANLDQKHFETYQDVMKLMFYLVSNRLLSKKTNGSNHDNLLETYRIDLSNGVTDKSLGVGVDLPFKCLFDYPLGMGDYGNLRQVYEHLLHVRSSVDGDVALKY